MDKYRADPAVANSDITNILISDELFLSIKKGNYRIPTTPVMKSGTLAHANILTTEKFFEEYYIAPESLHPKQKEFIDNLVSLMMKKSTKALSEEEIEDVYSSVYSKPKKGDGKILYGKLEAHVMGAISGREPITKIMFLDAEKRKAVVRNDKEASDILETANTREDELFFTLDGVSCKAKIDAYGINEALKKVTIGDLKISKDPISKEQAIERVKERDYIRQVRFYEKAILNSNELNEIYENLQEYSVDRYILFVDPVKVWIIKISDETAESRDAIITDGLNRVKNLKEKGICKNQTIEI